MLCFFPYATYFDTGGLDCMYYSVKSMIDFLSATKMGPSLSLSQREQIWHLNRVIVLFIIVPVMFGLKLLIAFCRVHVLCCVLLEILDHTTAVHVPHAAIKSSIPKHCHTFLIHVLLGLVGATIQFIVYMYW